jgi:hypothetical protein
MRAVPYAGGSEGKQAGKKRKRSPVPPAPVPALGWKHMVAALRAEPAQLGMPDMGVKLGGEKVYPDKFLGGGRDACVFRVRDLVGTRVPGCLPLLRCPLSPRW